MSVNIPEKIQILFCGKGVKILGTVIFVLRRVNGYSPFRDIASYGAIILIDRLL